MPTSPAVAAQTVALPVIVWCVRDDGSYDSGGDNEVLPVAFTDHESASGYADRLEGTLNHQPYRVRLLGALPERRTVHTVTITHGRNGLNERWHTTELWDSELAPDELRALLAGQPYTQTRRWGGRTTTDVIATSLDLDQARSAAREHATAVWGKRKRIVEAQRAELDAAVRDHSARPTGEPADLSDEELAELEAIHAAAAKRPWTQPGRSDSSVRSGYGYDYGYGYPLEYDRGDWDAGFDLDGDGGVDVEWVAAFARAAPRLLAELRRRRAEAT